jgi:prephenate dehydratase
VSVEAAYQGAPGAFSEDAARALLGAAHRLRPCRTLHDVFSALRAGVVPVAVIPVTNSLVGAVPGSAELMASHCVQVIAEHDQPIDQAVVAPPGGTLAGLRHLWSHPVALAQCTVFLARHPHITPEAAFDTAGAVADVLARGDVTHAALGSRRAADLYGGVVLADAVQDRPDNVTRFVLVRMPSRAIG